MKLSEKLLSLRKSRGISQEELAEKLNVSRQAISRWETDGALPDSMNILQLSKLYGVTADYLLNDDYESDLDVPVIQGVESAAKTEAWRQVAFFALTGLNIMIFIYQIIACFVLQSTTHSLIGTMFSVAAAFGFEAVYRKLSPNAEESAKKYRRIFYIAAVWLAAYFPVRLLTYAAMTLYPRPYTVFMLHIIIVLLYLLFSGITTWLIRKKVN